MFDLAVLARHQVVSYFFTLLSLFMRIFTRLCLSVTLCMAACNLAFAQSSTNYTFSTSTTGSLAVDLNSNVVDMSTGTALLVANSSDQGASPVTPIGFTYYLMGVPYTQFSATSNGIIQLGATAVSGSTYVASGGTVASPKISAFGGDLQTGSSGKVHSKVVGTAPNRCLVVEFLNMNLYYVSGVFGNDATYQVRLYEATGVMEFVYGTVAVSSVASGSDVTPSIGFSVNSTANNLVAVAISTNSSTTTSPFTENPTSVVGPIANLTSASNGSRRVYTMTPPSGAPVPADPVTLSYTAGSTSILVNWVDNSTNETLFTVTRATDVGFTANVVNTVVSSTSSAGTGTPYSALQTGLTPTTLYYFKIQAGTEGVAPGAGISGSQSTTGPQTFVSAVTGDWNVGATWVGGIVPSAFDHATITTGHTVSINAASLAITDLTVDGTLQYTTTPTSFTVNGNISVSATGIFNVFFAPSTGKTLIARGNITNAGTIDFSKTSSVLQLTGTTPQTVSGAGTFTSSTIAGLTFNNTSTTFPSITWGVNGIMVSGTTTFTAGRVAITGNWLSCGTASATGTLTHNGGGIVSGTFGRGQAAASTGSVITAGAEPTTTTSRYPFVNSLGQNRSAWFERTTPTGAGILGITYTEAAGFTGVSIVDASPAYTVEQRTNENWSASILAGTLACASIELAVVAPNIFGPTPPNYPRLVRASAVAGANQAGTTTGPGAQRNFTGGTALADLTGGALYLGLSNADFPNTSIAAGNWNSTATWSKGTVPTCADNVFILHAVTINSAGLVAKGVNIGPNGVLTMTSGDLTVDACTPRADATFAIGAGTFDMQGGTLNVRGTFRRLDTSTGQYIQSGGDIIVDGNNGVLAESWNSHIADFFVSAANHLQLTGGKLTVVDPVRSTTTTNCAFKVFPTVAGFGSGPNWQLQLGNGTVTNDGGHANGYVIQLNNTGSWILGGAVIINTGTGGTNRMVTTAGNIPMKDLTVTSGDYRLYSSHFVKGNIATTATGTITSSNTTPAQFTLTLSDWDGTTTTVGSRAQEISGPAASYRNLITSPTASFGSITVNNAGGVSILTTGGDFSLSGTLTMTKGIITTVAASPFRLGTTSTTATLGGTPAFDTYIDGPFRRTFGTVTASNTFAFAQLFPLGKGGSYLPLWISPTNSGGGTIFNAEAFIAAGGTPSPGVSNLSTNTWEVTIPTIATLTAIHTQLGDASIAPTRQILQAPSSGGSYAGTATGTLYTAGTPNTLRTNPTGAPLLYPSQWTGFLAYGDLTPCAAPSAQPTAMVISQVGATSLQVNYTAASPVADGYLVVRYPTASPTITNPVNATSYTLNATLGAGTVVAVGPQLQVIQTFLTASTTYTYVVYAYNAIGCGGGPVYLTTTPLQGAATTCATTVAAPTPFGATDRTMTTMTYAWTGVGTSYELDVATDAAFTNFVAGYNAKVVTTSPEVITGLNPGTSYFLRIRATDGTCWSANTTAQNGTLCSATATPYVENLNGSLTCLSVINVSGGNNWGLGAAPTTPSGMTGNTARILSSTTSVTNSYFVPAAVSLTGGTSYDFKLSYGNSSTTGSLNLEVLYNAAGPDGAIVTAGATQLVNLPLVNNTVSAQATVSFIPPTTGAYYILLRANNGTVGTTSTLHIDDILVDVTPACAASTAATITGSISSGSACGNTNTTILNASGYSVGLGMSYQWQKSPDNSNWTNMGSVINSPAQPNAPFTSDVFSIGNNYFRLQATCVNGPISTNSNVIGPINYSNPTGLTVIPATRCGLGTVTLGATPSPGDGVRWYAASTGGPILGSGTSFTTPAISTTTTYHAAPTSPVAGTNVTQGAGATTSATYSNPFYSAWSNIHTQHLITAAELSASGLFAGAINSVALNITSAGTLPMIDLSVKIGHSATTSLTAFDNNAGFSTVYTTASLLPTVGVNILTFSTPFVWDGTSNIVLEFCHGNAASTATMSRTCLADNTSYNSTIKTHVSAATSAATICGDVTTNLLTYTVRPQFIFNGVGACEGTRTPVVATVNTPPALTLSSPSSNLCQGTPSGLITVTSTLGDYDTYTWNPTAGVTGSAGAGYTFNPSASTNYTLTAAQTGGSLCLNTVTHNVSVNPVPTAVNASATPTTVCAPSGNSQLSVNVVGLPGTIKITEITQFRTGTGTTNPYPGYFAAGDQDYVEISNISSGPVDVSGYVFELWSGTTLNRSLTIPSGTILPGNAVMTIVLALGTDIPASFYFHCVGTSTGTSGPLSSGIAYGVILKNGSTNIDVVGTNAYAFPVAANVLPAEWSGSAVSASGHAGTVRTGTTDTNTGADWTTSGTTTQTVGTYNTGYVPGSSIASYAWTPTTFLSSPTIANPVATALNATTTYSVVVTTNEGCTATSGNVTVELVTGAAITTQPPATLAKCVGSTATISVVTSGATPTYQWRKDGTPLTNGGSISGATTATLTITGLVVGDAGSYDVDVTGCAITTTSSATALTVGTVIPTAVITPASATICPGGSVALTASGANTYIWSPGTGLSATNTASVTATPTSTITYTVTATNAGGCTDTETVVVTVDHFPSAPVLTPATAPTVCSGSNQVLTASSAKPATILSQGFESGATGWTFTDSLSTGTTIANQIFHIETAPYTDPTGSATFSNFSITGAKFAYSTPDAGGSGSLTRSFLTSPSFSTVGYTGTATVSYNHVYQSWSSSSPVEQVKVQISTNGGTTWIDLIDYAGTSVGTTTSNAQVAVPGSVVIPNTYLGLPDVKLRWKYFSNWGYYWAIDDVLVTGTPVVYNYSWTATPAASAGMPAGAGTPSAANTSITVAPVVTSMYTAITTSPGGCTSTSQITVNTEIGAGTIMGTTTVCAGSTTALTTDGATGGTWASDNTGVATVSSTGSVTGVAAGMANITYTVTTTACGTTTATQAVTVNDCNSTLTLTNTFIEGYMNGANMRPVLLNAFNAGWVAPIPGAPATAPSSALCDSITVELHNATSPYALAYTQTVVLGITGTVTVTFPSATNGNSYYVVVKGRNILETWSATAVMFTGGAASNSFATAFGGNLGLVGATPVIYSGDIDHDEEILPGDYNIWLLSNAAGDVGYFPSDLDGDGEVLPADYSIWLVNNAAGILVQKP